MLIAFSGFRIEKVGDFKVRASDANINVNDRFTDEEIEKMRNWLSWHWSDPTAGKRYRWKERGRYQLLFEFLLRTGEGSLRFLR